MCLVQEIVDNALMMRTVPEKPVGHGDARDAGEVGHEPGGNTDVHAQDVALVNEVLVQDEAGIIVHPVAPELGEKLGHHAPSPPCSGGNGSGSRAGGGASACISRDFAGAALA